MHSIKKITILEFAPCADALYSIKQDPAEGYLLADDESVTFRAGAVIRPHSRGTNAGGKATNVARVIDKLLEEDEAGVELIVFRADSPEGRYIHDLQINELRRVEVRPVVVEATGRFCINLSDPSNVRERVEFNISPHPLWKESSVDKALDAAKQISTDILLLAGHPPLVEPELHPAGDLPASVIRSIAGAPAITLDTSKSALAKCLSGLRQPDLVKVNSEEFASVSRDIWASFKGILVITDSGGCNLHCEGPDGPPIRIKAPLLERVYSTVGAGDATHAGLVLALWVRGYDPERAARFGMAVAAATVSSPNSTRGITREAVQHFFEMLDDKAG
ncbi:MAG TPA: PfkB family carbohydrate kinase [Blastocatellia bacterium]|nr:PfkB family carbohydrate kinase [Blastocatellia bacterium]